MNATVIGQPLPRVDGRLKVTGRATYAAEFARSKLTYGALIQSTIANGRVVKIDLSALRSAPGVIGILTRENAPRFRPYPGDLSRADAPGESRVPLKDDEIHYAGQHLGVVVAESFEQATYAPSLARVTYQTQPPLVTLDDERVRKNATSPEKFAGPRTVTGQTRRRRRRPHECGAQDRLCILDAGRKSQPGRDVFDYRGMGGAGLGAHSRMHARDQTTATSCCQRLRFATGKCAHRLSIHRWRLRLKGISMESHFARRGGGETGPATCETDSHPSTDVRFCRPACPHRAETLDRRGQNREAGGVAPRDDHAFFTHARLHRAMRQHVAHVVFVPERRGLAPTR
jgi:hypothetical protein